jgi:hypothetical protein
LFLGEAKLLANSLISLARLPSTWMSRLYERNANKEFRYLSDICETKFWITQRSRKFSTGVALASAARIRKVTTIRAYIYTFPPQTLSLQRMPELVSEGDRKPVAPS